MPGVRAVVTAADAPGKIGIGIADHPLFARDLIRYDGEPLAAVAADTLIQAKAALTAIDVEVEPLPAVLTMAEALAPEAPLVHPDWREQTALLQDAQLDWRKLMNLTNRQSFTAVSKGVNELIELGVGLPRQCR